MCVAGLYCDSEYNMLTKEQAIKSIENIGKCFIKPTVDYCSGQGCSILDIKNGMYLESGKNISEIIKNKGNNFVIQERIKCHSSIANLYDKSVNTFRIMTYRFKGEICHVPSIMRIGQGEANVDNAHAGGMFIAISDEGVLHKTAFTEFKTEFQKHPDSNLKFENYNIPLFPKCLEAVKKMHTVIPQIGCVNWDFTLDENGEPVLIEANLRGGSVWLFQMAQGSGAFGEKTPEILQWMKLMRKTKKSKRDKYAFGNMGE